MAHYLVEFEPIGRRGRVATGRSLLEAARQLGVDLVTVCGGKGTCGRCKIRVLAGQVTDPTATERRLLTARELEDGHRLACQVHPLSACKIGVPADSLAAPQRTQVEGVEVAIQPEPMVRSLRVQPIPPSSSDLRADDVRLTEMLDYSGVRHIDFGLLREFSPKLRSWHWDLQATLRGDEIVTLGPWPTRQLGLAVDLGTTKIAGYLLDLESGQTLAARGLMNPQISYGEDVIARIASVEESPASATELQKVVIDGLNQMAEALCLEAGTTTSQIVDAVLVGNTAMHHLLLRLPVRQLGLSPYVPAVSSALDLKARELGLRLATGAYLHLLPNIAGFVGGDHVAMLLATELGRANGSVLALDIGTNTEICLTQGGRMYSVSCASGPAFEGAHITQGMRAAKGAIEHLRLTDELVEYQTIEGGAPVGLCGSGILDALSELYLHGVVDRRGRIRENHHRVRSLDGRREFVLVDEVESGTGRPVSITQSDVRELQLAKSAIRTGVQVLLEVAGLPASKIDQVIIAGAFGSYIDVASAVTIGMLPALPLDCFRQVGNAAGVGAKLALLARSKRLEAQEIARRVNYVELSTWPRFTEIFARATELGEYPL